jgi:cell division protein FtsI/penicillin-binding protein 2
VALVLGLTRDAPGPETTLDPFVAAWARGDDARAARFTDRPREAAAALDANRRGLDRARVRVAVESVDEDDDRARARLRVSWQVPGFGAFAYRTGVSLQRADERWVVRWRPTVVHPRLDADTRLGTEREPATRGRIMDRDGRAIVTSRAIVRVGVQRDRVRDVAGTARTLAAVVDVDARAFARALRNAGTRQFVEAIVLRPEDAEPLEDALEQIRGVLLVTDKAPLAPTRGFARALLGTVAPATAEQVKTLDVEAGDEVGQFGLQAAFERRLGGTATKRVVLRTDGVATETLATHRGRRGRALRTTLDIDVQRAAERALGDRRDEAALVAIQPSSGDILAVANRPTDVAFDRAREGRYPPGSTFKVISTAALLREGLRTDETVPCPPTLNVGGRSFRNFEGGAEGNVPFARDFAVSCNTAFIALADRLDQRALAETARDYGLSQVPSGGDAVARAAQMIGQDRILATPLAMAGVAAAVADGRRRAPRLLRDDPREAGPRLPATEVETLRALMRRVVTEGSGTALAGVPGAVAGKSGTAEFGGGDPPPTHAWFIAFRGDLAVAVLIERGRSGGAVAAPVVARFLENL